MFDFGKKKAAAEELPDDLQDLVDFVDGKHSDPDVTRYDLTFRTDEDGAITMVMAADDDLGGMWGTITTESAVQLRTAMLNWRRLIQLEQMMEMFPPEVIAERSEQYPDNEDYVTVFEEIEALRRRLWSLDADPQVRSVLSGTEGDAR